MSDVYINSRSKYSRAVLQFITDVTVWYIKYDTDFILALTACIAIEKWVSQTKIVKAKHPREQKWHLEMNGNWSDPRAHYI